MEAMHRIFPIAYNDTKWNVSSTHVQRCFARKQ